MRRALGFIALAALVITACNLAGDVTPPPALATAQAARPITTPTQIPIVAELPPSAPNLGTGAALYAERCAACHGASGLGNGPQAADLPVVPAALGDPVLARQALPVDWYTMVTQGNIERFMPPFVSLNDQQRWDVVAFALTLSADAALADAAGVFASACADCHGEDGSGGTVALDLTDPAWMAERSVADIATVIREGLGAAMPAFAGTLAETEIWALAAYTQQRSFTLAGHGEQAAANVPEAEPPAPTQEDGAILAQVLQGTNGASIPEDFELTLHVFEGQSEVDAQTGIVDSQGRFLFSDLAPDPARLYILSAEYGGVRYASEVVHLQPGDEPSELPILIHETTQDPAVVQVDRLHLLFDFPAEGVVQVVELWVLSNLSDRTLVASGGELPLEIALPEGAVNLQFEGGALGNRFLPTARGFADQAPLRPGSGTAQLVFSFELPFDGRLGFSQPLEFPVLAATVLVPESGPEVRSPSLVDLGVREVTGGSLRNYEHPPLAAGESIELEFSRGLRLPNLSLEAGSLGWALGLAALVAAALVAVRWLGIWPRTGSVDSPPVHSRETLLRSIANLDDLYEAGELDEQEYREQRDALKQRALAIMKQNDD